MTAQAPLEESLAVHAWRSERLHSLGIPTLLADRVADRVDWHQVAYLVDRGCDPMLALEIAL
jgi:hypothetical protein